MQAVECMQINANLCIFMAMRCGVEPQKKMVPLTWELPAARHCDGTVPLFGGTVCRGAGVLVDSCFRFGGAPLDVRAFVDSVD